MNEILADLTPERWVTVLAFAFGFGVWAGFWAHRYLWRG